MWQALGHMRVPGSAPVSVAYDVVLSTCLLEGVCFSCPSGVSSGSLPWYRNHLSLSAVVFHLQDMYYLLSVGPTSLI